MKSFAANNSGLKLSDVKEEKKLIGKWKDVLNCFCFSPFTAGTWGAHLFSHMSCIWFTRNQVHSRFGT
jgi:hypothetical protein